MVTICPGLPLATLTYPVATINHIGCCFRFLWCCPNALPLLTLPVLGPERILSSLFLLLVAGAPGTLGWITPIPAVPVLVPPPLHVSLD